MSAWCTAAAAATGAAATGGAMTAATATIAAAVITTVAASTTGATAIDRSTRVKKDPAPAAGPFCCAVGAANLWHGRGRGSLASVSVPALKHHSDRGGCMTRGLGNGWWLALFVLLFAPCVAGAAKPAD